MEARLTIEASLERIIDDVRGGDVEAFSEIVRRYQGEIRRVVAFGLHGASGTEDLVQQAFVRAYLSLDSYEAGRDFGVWLRTIARNLVRNELRRSGREAHLLTRYRDHLEAEWGGGPEAEERIDARARALRARLERCKGELGGPARMALAMRYDEARSFDEVAQALGRTVAASRQLLSRTRAALRRCVEANETNEATT